MTNLNPDTSSEDHGLGWVTLAEGVDMSRPWLVAHTPQLFTAWQQTQSAQERLRLAQQIQQAAAAAESEHEHGAAEDLDDPSSEYVTVRSSGPRPPATKPTSPSAPTPPRSNCGLRSA